MLEKKDEVYAITRLTHDGLTQLLTDNINFEIEGFVLIDDEVNYNLVNPDQKIATGFDRVNYYENDVISDVLAQSVFAPDYRISEIDSYLFGNPVKHRLTPDKIKTQNDVRVDMMNGSIEAASEETASRNTRVYDFQSRVLSGNIPLFVLDDNGLNKWSLGIDIRGTVTVYQGNDAVVLIEQANAFSKLVYTVRFHGDSASKVFEYDKEVKPDEPLVLSTEQLKSELGLTYQTYGTFYIYKTFTLEGVDYTSDVLKIELRKEELQNDGKPVFDGKALILADYSKPYIKKNVAATMQMEENWIRPKVYGNFITDQVLNQFRVPGYASLTKEPLRIRFAASNLNNFHLNLQNIATGQTIPYFGLQGNPVDFSNYLTFPQFSVDLTIYRRLMEDGYYLMTNMVLPEKFEYIFQDEQITRGSYQYSLFGEKRYKAYVKVESRIYLGSQTHYESLNGTELLWYFTSPDQNLIYNFKQVVPVYMSDYENLILDLSL